MSKALEKLETIIEEQEEQISKLESIISYHERCMNWMLHRIIKEKDVAEKYAGYDELPYPRLEMQINPLREGWYEVEYIYGLVYKHFDGTLLWIPIGRTTSSGNQEKLKKPLSELSSVEKYPLRDGLHIRTEMRLFNLRGFLLCNGQIEEIDNGDECYTPKTFSDAMNKMKRN